LAKKFYVVWKGRKPGVYKDWNSCKKQVDAYAGAKYKSFKTWDEALDQYQNNKPGSSPKASDSSSIKNGKSVSSNRGIKTYTSDEISGMPETVKIFTDGGCEPNPGEAGSGVAIYQDGEVSELWYGLYNPQGTNNTAELNALHQGLLIAKEKVANGETAVLFSDSKYSIQCVTQWAIGWEAKGWKRKGGEIMNLDIINKIYTLHQETKDKIRILHVNGHVGVEGNELADRMTMVTIDEKCEQFLQYKKKYTIESILAMRKG